MTNRAIIQVTTEQFNNVHVQLSNPELTDTERAGLLIAKLVLTEKLNQAYAENMSKGWS